ncbi:unnamed protein product [Mytilus edulis]|uniref:Uncharacterized protein n=1 Tax=Mytilus edulis TaxID=6550 RepID=A0A8S3UIP1_MYTED|nr:unnamed protein product [Mytilus edulis]
MSVIYILLIFSLIDKGTSLKGLNICYDTERNIEYCCSGYEDINDTCTECKIGFMSIKGNHAHIVRTKDLENDVWAVVSVMISKNGCVPKSELSGDVNYTTSSEMENYSESMTVFELDLLIISSIIAGMLVLIGGCLGFTCFCKRRNKINVASSSYLQVINGSYGTVIDTNVNDDRCRQLNSYVTLVPKTSDTHYYMYYE